MRVNPAFTSQMCSGCAVLVQKGLSVVELGLRQQHVVVGHLQIQQRHNAARNRERLGHRLRGEVA
jgi:hypothetical protein